MANFKKIELKKDLFFLNKIKLRRMTVSKQLIFKIMIYASIIVGFIVLAVLYMIGMQKTSALVWSFTQETKQMYDQKSFSQYDLDVMRLFIVMSIITIILNAVTAVLYAAKLGLQKKLSTNATLQNALIVSNK